MKVLVDIKVDYGTESTPPWHTHHGSSATIDVDNFKAYDCLMALATYAGYKTKEEQNVYSFYIQNTNTFSIWHESGRWVKKVQDIMVQHTFTPETLKLTQKDNYKNTYYGVELIRFTPLPDTMKELGKISAGDVSAILSL